MDYFAYLENKKKKKAKQIASLLSQPNCKESNKKFYKPKQKQTKRNKEKVKPTKKTKTLLTPTYETIEECRKILKEEPYRYVYDKESILKHISEGGVFEKIILVDEKNKNIWLNCDQVIEVYKNIDIFDHIDYLELPVFDGSIGILSKYSLDTAEC